MTSRQSAETGVRRKLVWAGVLGLVGLVAFVMWPPDERRGADGGTEPAAIDSPSNDPVRDVPESNPAAETPLPQARDHVETGDPVLASVRGSVIDADGSAIEGAQVRVSITLFPIPKRRYDVTTDSDGCFRVDNMIAGRASIRVSAEQYCAATLRPRNFKAGERVELDPVTLHRGTAIDGEVRIDGKVAPGVQVFIVGKRDQRVQVRGATAVARAKGRFALDERLPPGHYRVLAMPSLQFGPFAGVRQPRVVVGEFELVTGQEKHTVYVDLKGRE